ncbi:acetoin utilization protein AcuC [Paenibacillus xerothermodurans]|uniref:Acetoin utilization protein AcuC n=1 Tax=Paenibacillus xerothermodurans TaxID=1977292 RepID=A0A2W1NXX7_PAEXE|nr:acetoin utilization protein AcuC [Paenibacillus xerothermodurans]PZE22556.1 acetoin utilization protein AcuC [Paenibacillus xerothermodurans]
METHPIFIYGEHETDYRFNSKHPFNQQRLVMTVDLLRKLGALPEHCVVPPAAAAEELLLSVHSAEYVHAVKTLSGATPHPVWPELAARYGLDTEDTPYFAGMHSVTCRIAGGSAHAVDAVLSGRSPHALHLAGGLHHAMPNLGAGFCVYNDAAVAIQHAKRRYGARVLYVDTDVHHGDGVQWSFYTDPDVCTLSIHETGKYLFPGTGAVNERGEGTAFGTSINIPVEPYTEDASWLECFEEVLVRVAAAFQPDLIVSQHGCDAHAFDPLSHVHCSMDIYLAMPRLIHQTAHHCCGGRWVALGGGGYDTWRVVPRAWSLLWLEMSDHPLVAQLEPQQALGLPPAWLAQWQPHSPVELPMTWLDPPGTLAPMPRREEITLKNRHTKELALLYLP